MFKGCKVGELNIKNFEVNSDTKIVKVFDYFSGNITFKSTNGTLFKLYAARIK